MAKKWVSVLHKNMRFKTANTVNFEQAQRAVERGEQVWVLPLMMRPGKQTLFFATPNNRRGVHEAAVQTCIIDARLEKAPVYRKQLATRFKKEVAFDKEKTIFASWKDNNKLLEEHDYHKWKLSRFVKKDNDRVDVKKFFDTNLDTFKEIYANVQAISAEYPGITGPAFSEFCQKSGLLDKHFGLAAADRLFIAANYDINEEQGDNASS